MESIDSKSRPELDTCMSPVAELMIKYRVPAPNREYSTSPFSPISASIAVTAKTKAPAEPFKPYVITGKVFTCLINGLATYLSNGSCIRVSNKYR